MHRTNYPTTKPPNYLKVDFHIHTIYSPDSLTTPEKLIAAARRKGLDRVVITDHNTIAGALRCKELDPERIIVGEEIETPDGEILAAYMTEEIPAGLPPRAVIARLRAQGAFISISHPFDTQRKGGWNIPVLIDLLPEIDAIETFNARCMRPKFNFEAQGFARQYNLPGTYGSDAHTPFELGRGALLLPPFHDAETLKTALQTAVAPRIILSSPLIHITSRWAVWHKALRSQ
jgi:hypothetical protein